MNAQNFVWLAADYHLPTTYSCRVPMSSEQSALAMPAPGPATIRLALVRTGIELFGLDYVRDELFPIIRAAELRVKPPKRVAISFQLVQAYKAGTNRANSNEERRESLSYREICHAEGSMTIYMKVPLAYEDAFQEVLQAVGYWGQANSLACCLSISRDTPRMGDYAIPLKALSTPRPVQPFFACIVSDFRDATVKWSEIMPTVLDPSGTDPSYLRLELYLWPMTLSEQHSRSKMLVYRSLI